MEFIKTDIEGVYIIEPKVFNDARGYFFEAFKQREFEKNIGKVDFVQDNESKSSYGVLRGLHYQKGEFSQAKLVRVIKGKVIDVAVDIRKSSPTFGKHVAVELSEDNKRQLFIPLHIQGGQHLCPTERGIDKIRRSRPEHQLAYQQGRRADKRKGPQGQEPCRSGTVRLTYWKQKLNLHIYEYSNCRNRICGTGVWSLLR